MAETQTGHWPKTTPEVGETVRMYRAGCVCAWESSYPSPSREMAVERWAEHMRELRALPEGEDG